MVNAISSMDFNYAPSADAYEISATTIRLNSLSSH